MGDFLLQPDDMVRQKRKGGPLFLHAALHAVLAYALLQAWSHWTLPAFILVSHACVDFVKAQRDDTPAAFVIDQVVHLALLAAAAGFLSNTGRLPPFAGVGYRVLVTCAGFVATVRGAGFLVGKCMKRIVEENKLELEGLVNGGKWIGQLERGLIFLLVLTGQPAGIGFLVAAKSILRFEESKTRKLAEYVLIGTLLSFSLAIALASATQWAVGR